jgi:hypothetical protein
MSDQKSFLEPWRVASHVASAAEEALFEKTLHHIAGRGPMPSDEERQTAKELRALAADAFDQALAQISDGQAFAVRPQQRSTPDQKH